MKNLSYKLLVKALSNDTRIELLSILMKKPCTVKELCEKSGFEQSRVSHNLKCLVHCGFVKSKRNGKSKTYYVAEEVMPLLKTMQKYAKWYEKYLKTCGVLENEV